MFETAILTLQGVSFLKDANLETKYFWAYISEIELAWKIEENILKLQPQTDTATNRQTGTQTNRQTGTWPKTDKQSQSQTDKQAQTQEES